MKLQSQFMKKILFASASRSFATHDAIPVTYLLNSAMLKLRFPTQGEINMPVRPGMSVADFQAEVAKQDKSVASVEIFQNNKVVADSKTDMFELLCMEGKSELVLRLNKMSFPILSQNTSISQQRSMIEEPVAFLPALEKQNLSRVARTTVNTMANLLSQNVDFSKGPVRVEDIQQAFIQEAKIYQQQVLRTSLFTDNADKLLILAELERMEKRKSDIERKEKWQNTMIFTGASVFFTAQFVVSYYTIFCVPWLGWDLVESITYTVTQGSFLLGLLIMARNRGFGTEYTEMSEFMRQKKQRKWMYKYNFDLHRYYYLKARLEDREREIVEASNKLFE